MLAEVELFQSEAPQWQAVLTNVQDWLLALIQRAVLPPRERAELGDVLDQLGYLPDDLHQWRLCPGCAAGGGDLRVMIYPVTNYQFARFVRARGYEQERYWAAGRVEDDKPYYWDDSDFGQARRAYPVVGISWYEARAYTAWLTHLLQQARAGERLDEADRVLIADLLNAGVKEVRLPEDHEWVKIAGGEGKERYPWNEENGKATQDRQAILERANTVELGWRRTTPVYLYPLGRSQPYGLMDLAGNVWEWLETGDSGGRVVRGGSWHVGQGGVRVSGRSDFRPHNRFVGVGFRCVAPVVSGS